MQSHFRICLMKALSACVSYVDRRKEGPTENQFLDLSQQTAVFEIQENGQCNVGGASAWDYG